MPEHLEGLGVAEHFVGPEAHVESGDLADLEVPGHLAVLAHPFGVICRVCHFHVTMGAVFGEEAVVGLYAEGNIPAHLDAVPAPEAVKLGGILAPGAGLDHQVGWLLRLPGYLTEDGLIGAQRRIAKEEFDEKGLGFSCFSIVGGEGVPPPVVAFTGLCAVQLTGIAGDIVCIEHAFQSFEFRFLLDRQSY